MQHFQIHQGVRAVSLGAPPQQDPPTQAVGSVALLGRDLPGLHPRFEVAEGDVVAAGQTLFHDRKHPQIAFVSPIGGAVSRLAYGPRKTLSACIIEAGARADTNQTRPDASDAATTRDVLQARGLWPAFRARPFGHIPAPAAVPEAIFVSALATSPLAPDPRRVLAPQIEAFQAGLSRLRDLTEGEVIICQAPGAPLVDVQERVRHVSFAGTMAAGLAGTHIARLSPGRRVWTLGYQDVCAIGHLFLSRVYQPERVVSVTGPNAQEPRLVRVPMGANIADLSGSITGPALSGDAVSGRQSAYLGRYHDQVTLLRAHRSGRPWIQRLFQTPNALIPTEALENALAVQIPPVPLMRALSVGDSETAAKLGCAALIEEDVAPLSQCCTSGADYGVLLRQVLDTIQAEAA